MMDKIYEAIEKMEAIYLTGNNGEISEEEAAFIEYHQPEICMEFVNHCIGEGITTTQLYEALKQGTFNNIDCLYEDNFTLALIEEEVEQLTGLTDWPFVDCVDINHLFNDPLEMLDNCDIDLYAVFDILIERTAI